MKEVAILFDKYGNELIYDVDMDKTKLKIGNPLVLFDKEGKEINTYEKILKIEYNEKNKTISNIKITTEVNMYKLYIQEYITLEEALEKLKYGDGRYNGVKTYKANQKFNWD